MRIRRKEKGERASAKTLPDHPDRAFRAARPADHGVDPAEAVTTQWPTREMQIGPPVRWRELLAVIAVVVLCDLTVYRGHGFAGYAVLFLVSPILFAVGAFRPRLTPRAAAVGGMLTVLAAKMIWCGSAWLVANGFALLAAFALSLSGQTPHVVETAVFTSLAIAAGYERLVEYGRCAATSSLNRIPWLNLAMPLAALLVFGTVFIFANPELLASVSEVAELVVKRLREWLQKLSVGEIVFCVAAAWVSMGLVRQASGGVGAEELAPVAPRAVQGAARSRIYPAYRNTLMTVIVLFAAYLVFEFGTLWFREFPKGFYYSGYAHEGAAWLTFALALATVVLSLVFRGAVLSDPRLPRLRALGWIWSAENFVLAVAVYHRMVIYIDFNGMSPMRIVALYGMSAVVAGFALVLWKIGHERSFGWLLRRQLWALALTVYLWALTPADAIVVAYNVRRILAGDPAPCVQLSVRPIGSEGLLLLAPLLNCDDAIIREGIGALLAQRDDEAEGQAQRRESLGWTTYQVSQSRVLEQLRAGRPRWAEYKDARRRDAALARFHEYAYQWY